MSTIEIVLDSHEAHLKNEFIKSGTEFSTEQLAVSDIAFRNKESGEILLICERKTMSDLYSSIISGRFREQRDRLQQTNLKICYILENFVENNKFLFLNNGTTKWKKLAVISGAIENLVLYHNIFILPTLSLKSTAQTIQNIRTKLEKQQQQPSNLSTTTSLLPVRKTKIMDNIFMNQLLVITGVSEAIAHAIFEQYTSVKHLVDAYSSLNSEKEREELLANIKVGKRRIGPVLSARICSVYN